MDTASSRTDLLLRLLGATELRAKVLSANIANQNTPGYTRQEVRFEDVLGEKLLSGSQDAASVAPTVVEDLAAPARPDGNNVALELELNAMRENRLLYETYASILNGHFRMLETAITESR